MLVIDDESDDASILDANKTKSIPYYITRLWAGVDAVKDFSSTFSENLFATYLAYTATPQANILQSSSNPLSPSDFLMALRTPSGSDSDVTFREPDGIKSFYTGGELFYGGDHSVHGNESAFVQELFFDEETNSPDLSCGLRAYIVGASINLIKSKKKYSELQEYYESRDSAKAHSIPNYSMVYHPSADTDEHFFGKQEIIHWINNGNLDDFVFDPLN